MDPLSTDGACHWKPHSVFSCLLLWVKPLPCNSGGNQPLHFGSNSLGLRRSRKAQATAELREWTWMSIYLVGVQRKEALHPKYTYIHQNLFYTVWIIKITEVQQYMGRTKLNNKSAARSWQRSSGVEIMKNDFSSVFILRVLVCVGARACVCACLCAVRL